MEGSLDKVLKYLKDIRKAYLKSTTRDQNLKGVIRITDITKLDECIDICENTAEDYPGSDKIEDIPEVC